MRRFWLGAAVAAAVTAGPAVAQQQQQARIQINLSPAGQAVAKRYLSTPNPPAVALQKRGVELSQQLRATIAAPKLDVARFGTLLRQQEQLQGQMMRMANDRMLRMLGELSEADRVAFVRGMANPVMIPAQPRK